MPFDPETKNNRIIILEYSKFTQPFLVENLWSWYVTCRWQCSQRQNTNSFLVWKCGGLKIPRCALASKKSSNNFTIEEAWVKLKTGLLKITEEVCGTTLPHRWQRETWWWSEEVEVAMVAMQKAFKAWKPGKGTKETYWAAKHIARGAVHHARKDADRVVMIIFTPSPQKFFA